MMYFMLERGSGVFLVLYFAGKLISEAAIGDQCPTFFSRIGVMESGKYRSDFLLWHPENEGTSGICQCINMKLFFGNHPSL